MNRIIPIGNFSPNIFPFLLKGTGILLFFRRPPVLLANSHIINELTFRRPPVRPPVRPPIDLP